MINEKQLRISNLVHYRTEEGLVLNKIDVDDLVWLSKNTDENYIPIALTEDILLKISRENQFFKYYKGISFYIESHGHTHTFSVKEYESLDEIQNLYFFITKIEMIYVCN